jgi:hypothetical protein
MLTRRGEKRKKRKLDLGGWRGRRMERKEEGGRRKGKEEGGRRKEEGGRKEGGRRK